MSLEPCPPDDLNADGPAPHELPPELRSLEAALAALVPSSAGLDRAGLLFAAGRRAAGRPTLFRLTAVWAATMTAAAAVLLVMVVRRDPPMLVRRIIHVPVHVQVPVAAPVPAPPDAVVQVEMPAADRPAEPYVDLRARSPYFRQLDWLLADGAGGRLEPPPEGPRGFERPAGRGAPASYRDLREELLDDQVSRGRWPVPHSESNPSLPGVRS